MPDKAEDLAFDPFGRGPDSRRIIGGLLGSMVFLVAGMVLTNHLHEALGIFDRLAASGAYWSPFFPVGHAIVGLPLFFVRTRTWSHWVVFLLVSILFANLYATVGTIAGLVHSQHSGGPALTASSAVFLALSVPIMTLHVRLFDRPSAPPSAPPAEAGDQRPRKYFDLALLGLPGLLLLAAFIDLVTAWTAASGATAGVPEFDWRLMTVFAVSSGFVLAVDMAASRRKPFLALIIAATILGTATLTVGATLAVRGSSAIAPDIVNTLMPLVIFFLVLRYRPDTRRRLDFGDRRE